MRRSFGRIRNRNGVFYIRYRVGGVEHEERAGTEKQAEKLLNRREVELGLGLFTGPSAKRTTFEDLVRMIQDDYRANQRQGERLEVSLKHLMAVFAGRRAHTITTDRLTKYLGDRLEAGAAPGTVGNELKALRRALRLAKRAGKLAVVPEFPQISPGGTRVGFFEADDFGRLLRALPTALRPVAQFAYLTGFRKAEVLGLQWTNVDWKSGMIRLEPGTTKTREGREFPFLALPELAELMRAQHAAQNGPWVFHRGGKPIRYLDDAWQTATREARCPGKLFHDLRRTAVRNLVRAGVPERVAMQLTGHKTRTVFDRYNIVNTRDLTEGVAKLAGRGTQGGQAAVA